jgi:hypothetical protein
MPSSKGDDPEEKVVSLLQQIRLGLSQLDDLESAEDRVSRLEAILRRVSDVLTLYGANVFTLAVHQVQIIKQLTELEETVHTRSSSKVPALPHFRRRSTWDDTGN